MAGSAGGLSRIDKIFGGNGYTETFSTAPLVFGAFPSLHSGCATLEALFLSHFFPRFRSVTIVSLCLHEVFARLLTLLLVTHLG